MNITFNKFYLPTEIIIEKDSSLKIVDYIIAKNIKSILMIYDTPAINIC